MFPTFPGRGEVVLAEAVTPSFGWVAKGDIVICVKPTDPTSAVIKRVAAVAGEDVSVYPTRGVGGAQRVKVQTVTTPNEPVKPFLLADSRTYCLCTLLAMGTFVSPMFCICLSDRQHSSPAAGSCGTRVAPG
jgi:hypothetical protein